MLIIDAVYIHESGGKVLLEYFLSAAIKINSQFYVLFDLRLKSQYLSILNSDQFTRINPSEKDRNKFYQKKGTEITRVFCFANVPPPKLNPRIKIYILFHNSLILSNIFEKNGYSFRNKLLYFLKRIYIRYRNNSSHIWIVQTKGMKSKIKSSLNICDNSILIIPFYNNCILDDGLMKRTFNKEFLYVADGVAQKNHNTLLDAWQILLNTYNLNLTLHLTISDQFEKLLNRIAYLNCIGFKIINHGQCDSRKINELYQNCSFLIYPSLIESFGLPLIEATNSGCQILASNLPYVFDIINPTATFDPHSASNIAQTINETLQESKPTTLIIEDQLNELLTQIFNLHYV